MSYITIWLALIVVLLYMLYKYFTKNYGYWKEQNIPFIKPYFLLGSFSVLTKPLHESEFEFYKKYGRIYGRFDGTTPVLSVADPDLLKNILVKDFHHFPNHRDLKFGNPVMDSILFSLEGEAWKRVRTIVSPVFTSSKLRKMMTLMEECTDVLLQNLEKSVQENKNIECQRISGAFTLDSIAKCAFGMKINSLHDVNNIFVVKAGQLFQCFMSWRTFLTVMFPKLMKLFRLSLLNPESGKFFGDIVTQLLQERKEEKEPRNDFLQLMMDAEIENGNSQKTESSNTSDANDNSERNSFQPLGKGLSHDEVLGQCLTFLIGGYDGTTSLLSYAIYNLAVHQDCQKHLIEEIQDVLSKHNNMLSYEALAEMKYLDAVVSETLRLCPPLLRLDRQAVTDYQLGDTGIIIKKGMLISIPVYAMQRDPEWYPQPEKFIPERFLSPDLAPPPYTYLPFGLGPRNCVASRFVMVEAKMFVARVLLKFEIHSCPGTKVPLEYTESRGILKANNVEVKMSFR